MGRSLPSVKAGIGSHNLCATLYLLLELNMQSRYIKSSLPFSKFPSQQLDFQVSSVAI